MSKRIIGGIPRISLAIKFVMMILLAFAALVMTSCTGETTIPVDSVSISHNQITLTVGDDFELTALVAPTDATEPEITFSSSNEAIATVDQNGLVTAIAAGTATITASAGDKSASCQVTVQAAVLVETINGFKAFEKGGLLGGEGGTYYPVTATAVGTDSVRYSGRGGLSWPDTANNAQPDAMGGYYDSPLQLDGLKVKFKLDDPMDFAGDHWHFISLSDQKQLFNAWNGSDPVQTFFVMIQYEGGKIKLQPHYRDVIDRGEGWRYLGKSQGVERHDRHDDHHRVQQDRRRPHCVSERRASVFRHHQLLLSAGNRADAWKRRCLSARRRPYRQPRRSI
ncbi:MAG: Ig-like domain-containing protein [Bacillus subtilis]|nr:Ig-like domain-containing protein [Bacillus subtilis]